MFVGAVADLACIILIKILQEYLLGSIRKFQKRIGHIATTSFQCEIMLKQIHIQVNKCLRKGNSRVCEGEPKYSLLGVHCDRIEIGVGRRCQLDHRTLISSGEFVNCYWKSSTLKQIVVDRVKVRLYSE